MKFAVVGATCFLLQFTLLAAMVRLGVVRPLANSISFATSAQLNFLLSSRLTWRDRPAGNRRRFGARWLAYNGTALLSLACDSAIFVIAYRTVGTAAGAALGVVVSTCLVFLVCNQVVFRSQGLDRDQQPSPGLGRVDSEVIR